MPSIKNRLVGSYCLVIFLTVLALELLFISAVNKFYYGSAEQVLVNRATVSATFYNKYFPQNVGYDGLKDRAKYILENVEQDEPAKVEVLDRQGNIIINSHGFTSSQKVVTPDFQDALDGKTSVWKGKNTGERIMAVSTPLREEGKIVGVLRYVASTQAMHNVVIKITAVGLGIGLVVILLAVSLSLVLAKSIISPLQEVTNAAAQMAKGNFLAQAAKKNNDEIGRLADTLNYMSREILKSDQLKNDFLSSISHELRTPLTSIKGWGETVLSGDFRDKTEAREGLKIICSETDRMIGLVEELLDFSQFQSDQIKITLSDVHINNILHHVIQQLGVKAREKNITLVTLLDPNLKAVKGDNNRLKQVLINLLDNALKFSPPDSKIKLTTTQKQNWVIITVTDNGEGIALEDLPRITNKFYKANINRPGSGLGLSIVKEIVELHQGKLDITSQQGHGTTVTVALPTRLDKIT